jgi:hypothetical protein
MANLHLFRRPGTGRPSLEVLEVMLESSFNMWYALRVMSTPEPKSREKYSTALAVIDEILPRREMLGPVGDSEIDILRAKVSQIGEELQEYTRIISSRAHSEAARRRYERLEHLEATLDSDSEHISDLERLRAEKHSLQLATLTGNSREKTIAEAIDPVFRELYHIQTELFGWRNEYSTLSGLINNSKHDAFIASNEMWMVEIRQNLELRKQVIELRNLLYSIAMVTIPERTLASIVARKFAWKSGEDAMRGALKGFELLGELIPYATLILDSLKEWRENKIRFEEAVKQVSGLIAIKMAIALWEEEIRPVFSPTSENAIDFDNVDEWKANVSDLHQRWQARAADLKAYLDSLSPPSESQT